MYEQKRQILKYYMDKVSEINDWFNETYKFPRYFYIRVQHTFEDLDDMNGPLHFKARAFGGINIYTHPYIMINLRPFLYANMYDSEMYHYEYYHIKDDHEIGSLGWVDWKMYLTALICHEYAHCVQLFTLEKTKYMRETLHKDNAIYRFFKKYGNDDPVNNEDHGEYWQNIYRVTRNEFVNKYN